MGKKKSKRKNNKRKSLGRAFLVTLFVTLSAGASVLFLVTFFGAEEKPEEVREEMPKVAEVEKEDIPEKIVSKEPEPRKAEMTEVSEMPEPVEEDDGFDESGCIRDENGRILVKKQETGNDEAI